MFSSITTVKNNLFKNFKNYFKEMNHKKTIITASIVILIFLTVSIIFTIFKVKTQVKLYKEEGLPLFILGHDSNNNFMDSDLFKLLEKAKIKYNWVENP